MRYNISFKYRFEVMIPLADNDGNRFPMEEIIQVRNNLTDEFGGCRSQPLAPFEGTWVDENKVYLDELMLFIVDAPRTDTSIEWFLKYKEHLKQKFTQIEIYLAISEIMWL